MATRERLLGGRNAMTVTAVCAASRAQNEVGLHLLLVMTYMLVMSPTASLSVRPVVEKVPQVRISIE